VFEIEDSGNNGLEGFFSVFATGTFYAENADGDTIFSLHPDSLNFGSNTSRAFCLPETLGINNVTTSETIVIYPNPTNGTTYIATETTDIKTISVFSITGQQLIQFESNFETVKVDLNNYEAGTYLIKIKLNKVTKMIKVQKIRS
jgi:hypothetical protein